MPIFWHLSFESNRERAMQDPGKDFSRRERQIMQVIFANGKATAKEVVAAIPDPPSRTAVRTLLTILVEKGARKYERVGREFVYSPSKSRESVGRGALNNILNTFFGGSIENLIASHFSGPDATIDESELNRIQEMIREAEASKKSKASNGKKKKSSKRKGSR